MTELTAAQNIRNKIDALYEIAGITGEEKAKELALMTAVEITKLGKTGATVNIDNLAKISISIQKP